MMSLRILLVDGELVKIKPLAANISLMHNFIVKVGKKPDIFKNLAGKSCNALKCAVSAQ